MQDPKAIKKALLIAKGFAKAEGGFTGKPSRMQQAESLMQQGLSPVTKGQTNINVYHGSPHKFEPSPSNPLGEFSASKIGTGEGAQAYGHGLYLTQDPKFASIYKTSGAQPSKNQLIKLRDSSEKNSAAWNHYNNLIENKSDSGHLYTVHLPDEKIEQMLDWDKPLSEQSIHVQKVIEDLKNDPNVHFHEYKGPEPFTGKRLYRTLGEIKQPTPESGGRTFIKTDPATVSELLRQRGIPGIKYKHLNDATNFVIFPGEEHNLNILNREARGGMITKAEGGFTNVYHGTHSDFSEFDPNEVDIGTHVGTKEQAINRLRNTANPFGGKSYGDQGYRVGANIMPLKAKLGKSLEMPDVGMWKDSHLVSDALIKKGFKVHDINQEAKEVKNSYEEYQDFLDSPENRGFLDELNQHLRDKGYDSIKYKNQVENEYGDLTKMRSDVAQYQSHLMDKIIKIEESVRERMPQLPDMNDPDANNKIIAFMNAKLEHYMHPHEADEIKRIREEHYDLSSDPSNYEDPHSYIILDPSKLRSVHAKFDPARAHESDLMAARGGMITKAEGGDVEAAPQQAEDTTPSRQLNAYGLYSHAAEAAEALKQEKGPPQQMIASLKGVKPDELYWSGVHNAFRDRKSITKQELADHFRNALPKYRVSTLTNDSGTYYSPKAKFGNWTAEGKIRKTGQPYNFSNYREVLNQIDNNEPGQVFQSSHWDDPNIISHVRLSDRESMPPKQKIPKAPKPDSVVKRDVRSGYEREQDTAAYSTPHKNIFVTPSMLKRGKYVVTHGPSGKAISGDPVDYYHAMDKAIKLNNEFPEVFDLNDADSINNFIKDPNNEKAVSRIREIISSPPPDLPVSKKAKEFTPEKILHVEESQSDFGQNFRKYTDKINEHTKELNNLNDQLNNHRSEIERIAKQKPHLINDQGRAINYNEFLNSYLNLGDMTPEQWENYNKDEEDWKSLYNHQTELENKESKKRSTGNSLSQFEGALSMLPKFPYVDNTSKWTDLNVKRILTDAAKGNYDKLIWTPGSVQSNIYGIGNSYSGIFYDPATKKLVARPKGRSKGITQTVEPEKISEYIGEELAKKLLEPNEDFKSSGIYQLTGKSLNVPNLGQESYYGKIFPRRLLELAREHDPEAQLSTHKDNDTLVNGFPALKITPKMRASILKNGFKAYKSGGYIDDSGILNTVAKSATDPQKAIRKALMIANKFGSKK